MQDTLQSYVDMLVLKDQKVARFELINGAKVKSSGGVKYIIGLRTGLTESTFKSAYTSSENVTIKITKATTGRVIGTGSTVVVTSTIDGSVVGEYVILIYGDINGDGKITTADTAYLSSYLKKNRTMTAAQKLAANINGDRTISTVDKKLLKNVILKQATINQSTGKVVR